MAFGVLTGSAGNNIRYWKNCSAGNGKREISQRLCGGTLAAGILHAFRILIPRPYRESCTRCRRELKYRMSGWSLLDRRLFLWLDILLLIIAGLGAIFQSRRQFHKRN